MKTRIKPSKFKINVFSNLVIKLLGAVIPFVLSPFVSRALLPQGLGNFTYANSIASYFSIVIAFGFLNYGTKKIAELRKNDTERSHLFWNITYVKIALFVLTSILYLFVINIFDLTKGFDKYIYYALYISLIGVVFDTTFYFQGVEKMLGFSIVNFAVNLLYTFLVIFFVRTPEELLLYTIFKSSIILLTSILSVPLIAKEIRYVPKPNWRSFKKVFLESLLFFIPSLILTITPIIDQTMLGSMTNTTEVGYYEAANKIKTIALVFTAAISSILLSRVSFLKSSNQNKDAHNKIVSSLDVSLFILLPLVVGICLVAKLFIPLYYGDDFSNSVDVMYWLTPSTLFSSIATLLIFGYYFATGKTKKITIIILICDSINLLTNIVGIKYFGAVGAAFTSSLANGVMTFLCIFYSRKDIKYKMLANNLIKYLISLLVMIFSVVIVEKAINVAGINNKAIQLASMITSGVIGYFVTFLAIKHYDIVNSLTNNYKTQSNKRGLTICHYCFGLKPYRSGGTPAFVNHLIDLQNKENNIILLYPGHYNLLHKAPYIKEGRLYKKDIRFRSFEIVNPKPIPICNGISDVQLYLANYPVEMWDNFLTKNMIDIIHVHTLFGMDENLFEACAKRNVKTIFTSHDLYGICPKTIPIFKKYCHLKHSELCGICSKYAISKKNNIILQSTFYNKIKNTKLIQKMRKGKVNERIKLESKFSNISESELIKLRNKESRDYSSLQHYYIGIFNKFDCLHFNSELSKKTFLKFINPKSCVVNLISNGKISDRRHLHSKPIDPELINFLILGTSEGMYEIIDLLNDAWINGKRNFKLTIYSKNECEKFEFIEKHNAYLVEEEEIIFKHSDCLLFNDPSFATFSFIIYEALSFGVPCVTCGDIGANQLISETKGGVVTTKEELRKTLDSILKKPKIISKWQTNLRRASMSFEDNDFLSLYKDIINKKG